MCPPATVMLMSKSMLLWWKLDSVPLPLVIKPKVLKEALQWSGKFKCKVTSIKLATELNLQCNYFALVERQFHSKNN